MKALLIVTAVLEAVTGISLLLSPALQVSLLLGASLDSPAGLTVARVAGAALLSLGTACWLGRNDGLGGASRVLVSSMLLYNTAAVAILVYANLGLVLSGTGLLPAVFVHLAMAGWCFASLRSVNPPGTK